jgi:hypothetical protein
MMRSFVAAAVLTACVLGVSLLVLHSIGSKEPPRDTASEQIEVSEDLTPNVSAEEAASPVEEPPRPIRAPDRAIGGWVRLMDGKPVWRARVRCLLGPHEQVKQVSADRKGWFCFEELDAKTVYAIEASTSKHAPIRIDNVTVGTKDLVFTLKPGGRLTGTVYSADIGEPLRSFTVHVTGPEDRAVTFEDTTGYFLIDGLVGGAFKVRISADDYADSETVEIVIPEGKEEQRNFLLPRKK